MGRTKYKVSRGLKKIGGKITVFDWPRKVRLGLNYQEFRKTECSRNDDSVIVLRFKF